MDLFVLCVPCLAVFVNCLVKQFAMCLGVVAILLLNVMDVFIVGGMCASKCSFHRFCLCFCMSEIISSFKSWITGICSPYVVSLCDFAYYVVP